MALSIKDWLNAETKDYGIGLAILGMHSKNRILLQNLGRKKNPGKLEYEIRKIAKHQGIDLDAKDPDREKDLGLDQGQDEAGADQGQKENNADGEKEKNESHNDQVVEQTNATEGAESESDNNDVISGKLKVVRGNKEVNFEDLPEELQARWNQNRDAYKEIRATHEKLKLMEQAAPEDRAPLTGRIAELDKQIRLNWEAIDAWQPEQKAEMESDAQAIDHKRINANRKYISTNIKKLQAEGLDEVKAAKIRDGIRERYAELKAAGESISQQKEEELARLGLKF
ncbi:hypothetical protein [uncultured Sunxiuqinia sp.]|uniref:hypothetical protein n=1 Tax=uncultured Sunxiuqinia sp. TaxID=1573825 RepID=UPI0026061DCD|nr:hypothetical protein [uncultured Sunxiuqinia sp.]